MPTPPAVSPSPPTAKPSTARSSATVEKLFPETVECLAIHLSEARDQFRKDTQPELDRQLAKLRAFLDSRTQQLELDFMESISKGLASTHDYKRQKKEAQQRAIQRKHDDYKSWITETMETEDSPSIRLFAVFGNFVTACLMFVPESSLKKSKRLSLEIRITISKTCTIHLTCVSCLLTVFNNLRIYTFEKKKNSYFLGSTQSSPFTLTTRVCQESEWTPEAWERHQDERVNKLLKIWSLESF